MIGLSVVEFCLGNRLKVTLTITFKAKYKAPLTHAH